MHLKEAVAKVRAEEHEADEAQAQDEWASDYEVHIHQEREAYIRRLCIEGSRAYLGRSADLFV